VGSKDGCSSSYFFFLNQLKTIAKFHDDEKNRHPVKDASNSI